MFSKRKFLNFIFKTLRRIVSNKKSILFIAPYPHHAVHLHKVVERLSNLNDYTVTFAGELSFHNDRVNSTTVESLKVKNNFDIVITTEFGLIPWWLSTKRVFFGHGIGPKISYQVSNSLALFDYSFCPCKPIFDAHSKFKIKVRKVGLPILDNPDFSKNNLIKSKFGIKSDLPLVVYAPSWSSENKLLNNIPEYIEKISKITNNFNVILSPHPNLLLPERCSGTSIVENISADLFVNDAESGFTTFEACLAADIIISDISSILFEAMSIGKKVFSDGNRGLFEHYGASLYYDEMVRYVRVIDWSCDLEKQISSDVPSTDAFIEKYLFNRGKATDCFVESINDILR